jgi:hypothetical protein
MLTSVTTTTIVAPTAAPSSPLLTLIGSLVAAIIGGIVALTVAALTLQASRIRWRQDAKRDAYAEILSEATKAVQFALKMDTYDDDFLLKQAAQHFRGITDASDRAVAHAHLLSTEFFDALNNFADHLSENVMPMTSKYVAYRRLGHRVPFAEVQEVNRVSRRLLRLMREAAYGDLGMFPRRYWRALRAHRRSEAGSSIGGPRTAAEGGRPQGRP